MSYKRISLKRNEIVGQRGTQTASRRFQATLQEDRRWRVSKMGENIEVLLTSVHTREAWDIIQRWYQKSKYHPTLPTIEEMDHTSTLREELYRRHPPEGASILILVQTAEMEDDPPGGQDIAVEVWVLHMGREGGPSGMREYHLKGWIGEAPQENDPET